MNLEASPCFVYDLTEIDRNAASFLRDAPPDVRVLYATMANARPELVARALRSGLGLFVNSAAHLATALHCGARGSDITFAASGNTALQRSAVAAAGCTFIADSVEQFRACRASHPEIRAGVRLNVGSLFAHDDSPMADPAPRLGLTVDDVMRLRADRHPPQILHVYVGTNLTSSVAHLRVLDALQKVVDAQPSIDEIDLGGGFSRSPANEPSAARMWRDILHAWGACRARQTRPLTLTVEPGRAIAASAGKLYATVTDVKDGGGSRFVLVDTSSTWYPRTLIHNAPDHNVTVLGRRDGNPRPAIICGCTTYSNDVLARCLLPAVEVGDLLEFSFAGAYCESMHLDFLGVSAPQVMFVAAGIEQSESRAANAT